MVRNVYLLALIRYFLMKHFGSRGKKKERKEEAAT